MATLSPMMQQYMRLKEQNPDTLLFFRVGDFYEMFFEDALTASRELELTLTGKDCGMEERAPMCGVPYHAVDTYVARLVEKGYRVAIGEQMQDPALAKGLVDRDVIRIVTAGTLTDSAVIGEKRNNFLCSLCVNGKRCGIAACDVSTGEFLVQQVENMPQAIKAALAALSPGEIITNAPDAVQGCTALKCVSYASAAYQNQSARDTLLDDLSGLRVDVADLRSVLGKYSHIHGRGRRLRGLLADAVEETGLFLRRLGCLFDTVEA